MSVLIKGMEMPKACEECALNYDSFACIKTGNRFYRNDRETDFDPFKGRLEDCPLVPVQPHGRLIDADAYESLLRGIGNREYRRENGTICDAIKFLHPHYAPTIIPAEEEPNGRA